MQYRIRQKFRGRKISPKASALYWDKNIAKFFYFTNSPHLRQEVVGGASVPPNRSSREKRLAAAPISFSLEYLLILILVF